MVLNWPTAQTLEKVEILYRYLKPNWKTIPETELDTHICERNDWVRRLLFADEIEHNNTHYIYTVNELRNGQQYEVLVKTFDNTGLYDARSEVKVVRLEQDNPPEPIIRILEKTNTSITIKVTNDKEFCQYCVDYYDVEVYQLVDDTELLDRRDFCTKPILNYNTGFENGNLEEKPGEDIYEDCCARKVELDEESAFFADIKNDYVCSRDKTTGCLTPTDNYEDPQLLRRFRLDPMVDNYTLQELNHFRMYSIQVKACNFVGCSYNSIKNERTNHSIGADLIDTLYACKVPTNTTPIQYHVYFGEPKVVNGAIVAYVLHYREYKKGLRQFPSHVNCITRLQHVQNNYRAENFLYSDNYNQVSIHVFSLSGDVRTKWINITNCQKHEAEYVQIIRNLYFKKVQEINTKIPVVHQTGIYIPILLCITVALTLLFVGVFYKQRYWYRILVWYRNYRLRQDFQDVIYMEDRNAPVNDREILVVGQNRVHYRNPELMEDVEAEELFRRT